MTPSMHPLSALPGSIAWPPWPWRPEPLYSPSVSRPRSPPGDHHEQPIHFRSPMPRDARCPHHPRHPVQRDWWPNQLNLGILHQHAPGVQPDGRRLRLRRSLQEARLRRAEERPGRADDRLAGLVAGRLGPLRRPVHPHGLAQRRHLPHGRRPRRRRHRQPALRPDQQLARQRQPRQGAPPALADQAEIRQRHFLGRPVHPGRQRGHGIHGLQDLRLRRRSRRHLAARRRHLLGRRKRSGWPPATSPTAATAATAIWKTRWPPCRWA